MSDLKEILTSIESLSKEDFIRLKEWFLERDWEMWDKEIEYHSETGKLDFLVKEAQNEKENKKLKGF